MLDIASSVESTLASVEAHTITNIFLYLIIGVFILSIVFAFLGKSRIFTQHTPNLLTSLGILGTFIGIVIGLLHFDAKHIDESIELLKEADIVVTNPPFSLFRDYIAQLIEYDKKFIVVGHQNAITYKDVFKYIKDNKLWLGYGFKGGAAHFINKHYEDYATAGNHQEGMIRVSGVVWFTNLDISKRHDDLILYKQYDKKEYLSYENYNAINVNKTKDIPVDFDGDMGVPITFLNKYNPEQFEIIGLGISNSGLEIGVEPYKEVHKKYRKEIQKRGAVNGDLYMMIDKIVTVPYARILIRNKKI